MKKSIILLSLFLLNSCAGKIVNNITQNIDSNIQNGTIVNNNTQNNTNNKVNNEPNQNNQIYYEENSTNTNTNEGIVKRVSIISSDNLTIAESSRIQIGANVEYNDSSVDSNVKWSSSDNTIATVNPDNGFISSIREGTTTIFAISMKDPTKKASIVLSVKRTPIEELKTEIMFNGNKITNLSLNKDETKIVQAFIKLSDGTLSPNIIWKSSNNNIVSVNNGSITGINNGTATITAMAEGDSTKQSNISVIVGNGLIDNEIINPIPTPTPTSIPIQITPTPTPKICTINLSGNSTEEVVIGGSKKLSATVSCTGQSDNSTDINWTSSDSSIASISTSGSVSGYKKGTVTITASYKNDTSITTSKTINIIDALGNETRAKIGEGKLFQPKGIDVRGGKIFVVDYDKGGTFNVTEGRIQIFDTSGNYIKTIMGEMLDNLPMDLTGIASDGSRIWVINKIPYSQQAYNIYSFDYNGTGRLNGSLGLTGSNGTYFTDIAIDPSTSNLYVASLGVRSIIKAPYDSSGVNKSAQEVYFAGANRSPAGVTVDDNGNVLYTDASTNPPIIRKLSATKELLLEFNSKGKNGTGPSVSTIGDIAYDPRNGGIIYVLAKYNGSNTILRYDGQGNYIRSFGSGLTDPRNIAVDSEGAIFVTDFANNVVHQYGPGK
jgi:uncharacterized protein YjdB